MPRFINIKSMYINLQCPDLQRIEITQNTNSKSYSVHVYYISTGKMTICSDLSYNDAYILNKALEEDE